MSYPTPSEVEQADREQLAKWHRFLPPPYGSHQTAIMDCIVYRFDELGGMTPKISKTIGFKKPGAQAPQPKE